MARRADPTVVITRAVRLTQAGLVAERLTQAFWLPVALALLGFTVLAFDLLSLLPVRWRGWATAGFALLLLVSLILALRRFHWPRRDEAVARLDRSLPGRPLAALSDEQAIGGNDAASSALWALHRGRMLASAAKARAIGPRPGLPRRDPFGLRLIALTGAAVALTFGQPLRLSEVGSLTAPAGAAIAPAWEGWITPPAYTGRPALYLNEVARESFEVPSGSRVVMRLYGADGVLSVQQGLGGEASADDTGQVVEFPALQTGRLAVEGPGGRAWHVLVLRDEEPEVTATEPLRRGRGGILEQPFRAVDDYGITFGEAEIVLDLDAVDRSHGLTIAPEARDPLRIDLPLPMTANRTEFDEILQEDMSQHVWAHLPVRVVLRVADAAGQSAESRIVEGTLPGRRFFEPAALAVSELRRDILWNRANAPRSAQLMRAMLHQSEDAFRAKAAPGELRGAVDYIEARLDEGLSDEARDELAERLWDLALLIEEGELANARERLQRAQEMLDQAMRDGASSDEIAALMEELREAMRDYIRMLAEQPRERGERDPGEQMQVTGDQIQELMNRIQELMEEGRMDEAAELMAQLNALLENLQVTEGQGEGGEPMPGDEAMEGLGDTLSDQQDLADDTFRDLQEQFGRGEESGEGEGEGEGEGTGDSGQGLAERQQELRERLRGQQLQTLPGEGTPEGDSALDALEDAERAMNEAERALRDGETREALERQAEALEAMREGLRQLGDAMRQDRRERADNAPQGQGQGLGRDPLGREREGDSATGGEGGTTVPGADPRERARDLMDEIRRRSAELERPEAERDYLNRLIDRF
ncbi:DUF4175 family protein [Pararhodobacter sp. SW119]|uniref:DUF4175 domain-containing protein n=1 Tax=Pararhodobacter sp. SW119 TaxID=2780075 RepID=UPI001AE04781|nr:DUF4175 family protein [Pararhodobacter sp. SW119]